jgi:hypothetical protein
LDDLAAFSPRRSRRIGARLFFTKDVPTMENPYGNFERPTPDQYFRLRELGCRLAPYLSRQMAQKYIDNYEAGAKAQQTIDSAPTEAQEQSLIRLGIHPGRPISKREASTLIHDAVEQRRSLPPTDKQEWILKQHGQWRPGMSRGEAFDLIGEIMAGGGQFSR